MSDTEPEPCILCDWHVEGATRCPAGCGPVCPECATLHRMGSEHQRNHIEGRAEYLFDLRRDA